MDTVEPLAATLDDVPDYEPRRVEVAIVSPHQRGALLAASILIDYAQTLEPVKLGAALAILEDLSK